MFKISLETLREVKKQLREYEGLLAVIGKSPQGIKKYQKVKKLNKGLEEYNT